jgi:D-glycero-D-manno-heptose 1,7-bisphosphate phosphatase
VNGRPAVFLDRDGVLNELVPDPVSGAPESPLRIEDVRLIPGAAAAAKRLGRAGFALVCVSNQPAAAKGLVSVAQLMTVHEHIVGMLAEEGVRFRDSHLCLHHEQGVVPELSGACACRKPAPGMLLGAAAALGLDLASSWMVGDTDADVLAGHAAGCRTALLRNPGSAHKRSGRVSPEMLCPDLAGAVAEIAHRHGPGQPGWSGSQGC